MCFGLSWRARLHGCRRPKRFRSHHGGGGHERRQQSQPTSWRPPLEAAFCCCPKAAQHIFELKPAREPKAQPFSPKYSFSLHYLEHPLDLERCEQTCRTVASAKHNTVPIAHLRKAIQACGGATYACYMLSRDRAHSRAFVRMTNIFWATKRFPSAKRREYRVSWTWARHRIPPHI